MQERVRGYADAVLDGLKGKDLAQAASQLKAFSELLAESDDLRTAFSLPTTSAAARRAIVQDLLAKKALPSLVALLAYAAQVGTGADLPEDVAVLAYVAASKSSGMVAMETGPVGRLTARQRLQGYATALLSPIRDEKRLANIEDELFRFMRTVAGNEDLRVALTTNELPVSVRHNLVSDLLDRRASMETGRMATYAADIGRPRDYLELLEALVDQVAAEANRRVADVRSAIDMTQTQRLRLGAALARLTGSPIDVRVTVEPGLLGGFIASVGDMVVDASLRHRLERVGELLSTPTYSPGGGDQRD